MDEGKWKREVKKAFETEGFRVFTEGWPDLLCFSTLRGVIAIELKGLPGRGTPRLRAGQVEFLVFAQKVLGWEVRVRVEGDEEFTLLEFIQNFQINQRDTVSLEERRREAKEELGL